MRVAALCACVVICVTFQPKIHARDLSGQEHVAYCKLVEEVSALYSRSEDTSVSVLPIQLAYIIIYSAETGVSGSHTEDFLKSVSEKVSQVRIPSTVMFSSEREKTLSALARHATSWYSDAAHEGGFSPIPSQLLIQNKNLGRIAADARDLIIRKTGYKFEEVENKPLLNQ